MRDLGISNVDVGVYAGKYVNANQLSGIQMSGLGRYGYLFVNNTENSVFGGFTTGGGLDNVPRKVIAGRGSGYNWFVSVQAEPGGDTSYFDFDNHSEANAVIGHDNCPHGGSSQDPAFLYQEGRSFHMGNFNTTSETGGALGAEHCFGKAGNAEPCVVQIEGSAYIRNLTTFGLRCASKGFKTDLCDMGDEVGTLRKVVASQEDRIAKQEARMATLERALEALLEERQQQPENFNGVRSPLKSDMAAKTDDSDIAVSASMRMNDGRKTRNNHSTGVIDATKDKQCCAGGVVYADCWGFGAGQDTQSIQSAIDCKNAHTVIVKDMGSPWIVSPTEREGASAAIHFASNKLVIFKPGVVILAKRWSFKGRNDNLAFIGTSICRTPATNITIVGTGAVFRMWKHDYQQLACCRPWGPFGPEIGPRFGPEHPTGCILTSPSAGPCTGSQFCNASSPEHNAQKCYVRSEQRHGLNIWCGTDITVIGLRIESTGGDGIMTGGFEGGITATRTRRVVIRDVVAANNHRQGMSVISGN